MPRHLRPTAPIARNALLPGDPARALLLAQELLEAPRMSNHHRGLWGYYGETREGMALTIQSTGMGGPSAALVVGELAKLGVRRAIRVGTAAGLTPELRLGQVLAVSDAIGADGTSAALIANSGPLDPDPTLLAALSAGETDGTARVASVDLLDGGARERSGARLLDMESAAVFARAAALGVEAAALLVVSEIAASGLESARLADDELERAAKRMGRIAVTALGS